MRSEFEELKRFAIADILSVSGRQKTTETVDMHINTIIDIAFLKGQQASQSKVDELQKRVDALTLALDQIAYPIPHMQKEAELNGCELNGYWAVKMSEDNTYSKDIARRALEKEQALKGDQ